MINTIFAKILNMSITAGIVILVILLIRFLLKNKFKSHICLLWLVVIYRLLCPVSMPSKLSLFNAVFQYNSNPVTQIEYLKTDDSSISISENVISVPNEKDEETIDKSNSINYFDIVSCIWIIVTVSILSKNVYEYVVLKRKLKNSIEIGNNIYENNNLNTAFVTGIIKPEIYIPCGMSDKNKEIVISHETQHINSLHHITKFLAFIGLCLHWFNPLVWIFFNEFEKDMEISCDEKVIEKLGEDIKSDYSTVLLSIAKQSNKHSNVRLAFGESNIKERISNILKFRKPTAFQIILGIIATIAVATTLILNPANKFYINSIWATVDDNTTANFYIETPKSITGLNFYDDRCTGNLIKYAEMRDINGEIVGWVSCYKYESYEGEEDNPSAIYSELSLSSARVIDVHTENYNIVKTCDYGSTALTKIYYGDGRENIGILSYDKDTKVFMLVEFDSTKISEKLAEKIAKTISISKTIFYTPINNMFIYPVDSEESFFSRGYYVGELEEKRHYGLDIAAPKGSEILASASGTVLEIGDDTTDYGKYIAIDHGEYVTFYAHCSDISKNMTIGDYVQQGEVIAFVGNTGKSTGNHLHFEIRKKSDESGLSSGYTYLSPEQYIK